MAVATTFGVASTGTAISALSGAAATNAALAWLGGGAIAAGGGGMAGGSALLALAGPVGWGIGGLSLVGSGLYLNHRNKDHAKKATQACVGVEAQTQSLRTVDREIRGLRERTNTHANGCLADLAWLTNYEPKDSFFRRVKSAVLELFRINNNDLNDYRHFSPEQKERLAALINHVRSLSELLRTEVTIEKP